MVFFPFPSSFDTSHLLVYTVKALDWVHVHQLWLIPRLGLPMLPSFRDYATGYWKHEGTFILITWFGLRFKSTDRAVCFPTLNYSWFLWPMPILAHSFPCWKQAPTHGEWFKIDVRLSFNRTRLLHMWCTWYARRWIWKETMQKEY